MLFALYCRIAVQHHHEDGERNERRQSVVGGVDNDADDGAFVCLLTNTLSLIIRLACFVVGLCCAECLGNVRQCARFIVHYKNYFPDIVNSRPLQAYSRVFLFPKSFPVEVTRLFRFEIPELQHGNTHTHTRTISHG
jgi:hypothetical protein